MFDDFIIKKNALKSLSSKIDWNFISLKSKKFNSKDDYIKYFRDCLENNLDVEVAWNKESNVFLQWFDRDFYILNNPEISKNAFLHFVFMGYKKGLYGSKLHQELCEHFDKEFYLSFYNDVRKNRVWGCRPLEHFFMHGVMEHRAISEEFHNLTTDFDSKYYSKKYNIKESMAWVEYMLNGFMEDNDINEEYESIKHFFDEKYYETVVDSHNIKGSLFFHFISQGAYQLIASNAWVAKLKQIFDPAFYNKHYGLQNAPINGYAHYIKYGSVRNYFVNELVFRKKNLVDAFDAEFYRKQYKDLANYPDPFFHYLAYGIKEGRYGNLNQKRQNISRFMPYHCATTTENEWMDLDKSFLFPKLTLNDFKYSNLSKLNVDVQNILYYFDKLVETNNILVFSHNAGGGAELYLKNKITDFLNYKLEYLNKKNKANLVCLIRYNFKDHKYSLELISLECKIKVLDFDPLILLELNLHLNSIYINSLYKYPENQNKNFKYFIIELKNNQNARLVFLGHDFDLICNTPSNSNIVEECNVDDFYSLCDLDTNRDISIIQQRIDTQNLLEHCDECIFFSQNTIELYSKVINFDKVNVVLKPHALNYNSNEFKVQKNITELTLKKFTVAICGNIEKHKGADLILSFAKVCLKAKIDITILIIGSYQYAPLKNMIVTGSYDLCSLPRIINIYKPDCFFFSSICAETFSYVAHDLQLSNLPILCFDLGAQAETIKEYKHGIIIDSIDVHSLFNSIMPLYCDYKLKQKGKFISQPKYLFIDRTKTSKHDTLENISVVLNIPSATHDYMTWVNSLSTICVTHLNLYILVPETLDFEDKIKCIEQAIPQCFSLSIACTKCGNGLWTLYNNCSKIDNNVLYISAFNPNVSVLEKWYTVEYILGHSSCLVPFYQKTLSTNDFIWLDNFIGIHKKYRLNALNSVIAYMNERMEYCPLGRLVDYLTPENFLPSYIGGYLNTDCLKSMDCFFANDSKIYFSDISDISFISLLLFSNLHDFKYSVISPESVLINGSYNLEDVYKKWCITNFNPLDYINKYADIKNDIEFANRHFLNYGFYENRDYCDYLQIDNLNKLFPNVEFQNDEIEYYSSYKEAALANYLFHLNINDYQDLVARQKFYVSVPSKYNNFKLDYEDFKISFLVPIYNSAQFLRNCLDSIYNVDYPNFEVVLCDDGSSDDSVNIIKEYAQKHPSNTIVILHETNECFAKTHKDLINASSGNFFTIVDADDYIAPNYARIFIKFMLFYNLDVAICAWSRPNDFEEIFDTSEVLIEPRVAKSADLKASVGNWTNFAIPNIHYGLNRKCYKKESFIRCNPITIDENFAFNEDFSATLKLFTSDDLNVGFINNRIYAWYNNINSVSYAPTSERTITDFLFTFFDDLKDVITLYPDYEDKLIPCIQKHLFAGLYQISDLYLLQKRLEFLAKKLDLYIGEFDKFDKKIITFIKANFNLLTYKLFSKLHQRRSNNKIAVIDTIGHTDLRDCLLNDFDKNEIEYFYGICSKHRSFCELFDFMREVNSCSVIITDGGWGQDELVTRLPIINTWHGMGALKYVSRFPVSLQPNIGFSSSSDVNFCYRWMYNLPNSRILPFGNLLASKLLDDNYMAQKRNKLLSKYPQMLGKKIYLWVPTFRGVEPNYRVMSPSYDFEQLSKQLSADELFLVKWHPCLKDFASDKLPDVSSYKNIFDVTEDDLVELLSLTSVCLTDYSSCVFYASVMNIPVGIISTDVDEYQGNRGFYINLRTEMPCEVFEQTDVGLLLNYIRTRSNKIEQYVKFRKIHVSGVKQDVPELMCKFIKAFIRDEISVY